MARLQEKYEADVVPKLKREFGIKNPMALKYLRQVEKGDLLLVYHTGNEKAVVGIAQALGSAYPDPKRKDPNLAVIDLAAVAAQQTPRPAISTISGGRLKPCRPKWSGMYFSMCMTLCL